MLWAAMVISGWPLKRYCSVKSTTHRQFVICLSQRLGRACVSTCRVRWNREWLISVFRTLHCAHTNANELSSAVALRWRLTVFGWLSITHRCYEQLWLWVGDRYSGTARCSLRLRQFVICLSQRLSRACLSTCRIRRNREWLISVLRTLPCAHSKASWPYG